MTEPQHLVKGVAGTLVSYPPVLAQPTSAVLRYQTPSTPMQAAGDDVAATVDTISAIVQTAAAAGARELVVTVAKTWVRGRRYVVETGDGLRFDVEAMKGGSSATLELTEPLVAAVAANSTVKGFAVTYALTADECEENGGGLALWKAVIEGATHSWPQAFRLVERERAYSLTSLKLQQQSNISERLRDPTDDTLGELIESAWSRYVRPSLLEKGVRPERIITPEEIEPAHIAACELVATRDFTTDPQVREDAFNEFARTMRSVLASAELWYDAPESEVPARTTVNLGRTRLSR